MRALTELLAKGAEKRGKRDIDPPVEYALEYDDIVPYAQRYWLKVASRAPEANIVA